MKPPGRSELATQDRALASYPSREPTGRGRLVEVPGHAHELVVPQPHPALEGRLERHAGGQILQQEHDARRASPQIHHPIDRDGALRVGDSGHVTREPTKPTMEIAQRRSATD